MKMKFMIAGLLLMATSTLSAHPPSVDDIQYMKGKLIESIDYHAVEFHTMVDGKLQKHPVSLVEDVEKLFTFRCGNSILNSHVKICTFRLKWLSNPTIEFTCGMSNRKCNKSYLSMYIPTSSQ